MPILHLLGTGAALGGPHRTTTMLAVSDDASVLVVDCGGDLVQRLLAANLSLDALEALVITHEHPDHVGGFPLFMEKLWLAGRRRPLPVLGITPALAQARRTFDAFDTSAWDGMPDIDWREAAYEKGAHLWKSDRWHVTATPVQHAVSNIGLRIVHRPSGRTVAYSSDTEPVEEFARLAHGADVMVHEATGEGPGHSSAAQAAEIAVEADVDRLLLVHLPPGLTDADLKAARTHFPDTALGKEGGRYPF